MGLGNLHLVKLLFLLNLSQNCLPFFLVTPMGSSSSRPQEIEIGESGFALLFPQIEGIKIQPFHFIKDPKKLTLERQQLTEVGKSLFTGNCLS